MQKLLDTIRGALTRGNPRGMVVPWGYGPMSLTGASIALPKGLTAEIVRPLNATDLALLDSGGKVTTIKRIRDSHHKLAALVAAGLSLREIQEQTGYSYSRISILRGDPTFQQLVTFYRTKAVEANINLVVDVQAKMSAVLEDVIDEMHERLHDDPTGISPDMLTRWGEFLADRTGHGPTHKSISAHANLNDLASKLAAGRQRGLELSAAEPAAKPDQGDPPKLPGPVGGQQNE